MKHFYIFMTVAVMLVTLQFQAKAQPGSSCTNPYVISGLPFNQTGMTTNGFPDIFDNTDACTSSFMTGNDFIFSYTPTYNQTVNITLSNTGTGVGLFVTDMCPDIVGVACVAMAESFLGNPSVNNVNLTAGTTYFIVISTQDPLIVIPNPSTNFDISMEMLNPFNLLISGLINPVSGCGLTASEAVSVRLINTGNAVADSFNLTYIIGNNSPVTEFITDSINPGDSLVHTFTGNLNLSYIDSTYHFVIYHDFPDADPSNDTVDIDITNSIMIATFPYYQDFESGNGSYSVGDANPSWAWGTPVKQIINHASSPVNCWVTSLTGNYNQGEASYLLFPCLNFSGLTAPMISFDLWTATAGTLDYSRLEYSKDNGLTWQTVGQMNDPINWYDTQNGWGAPNGGWKNVRHRLDSLAGFINAKLRIYFYGNIILQNEGIAVDNIHIYQSPSNDLGISQILSPVTRCGLSNTETVEVIIQNYGVLPQSNFPVNFSVNGVISPQEIITATLNPGSSMTYIFTNTANLSVVQQYHISAFTSLASDTDHSNDTTTISINNMLGISTYPYFENFETSDGGWVAGGLNASWIWGQPSKPTINHAASPTQCWITGLSGFSNLLENSTLMGPCFDFSTLSNPEIEFDIWYETSTLGSGMDSIVLKISVDSGATWKNVGYLGQGYNWYNTIYGWSGSTGHWLHARNTLDSAGGYQNAKLRFHFYGPMATMVEGVAIDNIHIHEASANDLGVMEILSPVTSCNLTANEPITVKFTNYGSITQNHFPISYKIDNGPWKTDTIVYDVYQGDILFHVFSQTGDFSAQGTHTIVATTGLINDENHLNDTISTIVNNSSGITTFPYFENFEASNGDWYTSGTSSWAWGVPTSPIINMAHSPTHCWKTNISGYALSNENSYLFSPCFDFTGISNPHIELWVWHEMMMLMGAATLEASIDGGFSWFVIGQSDTLNWYSGNLFPVPGNEGWSGSSAGWRYKTHALTNCGNMNNVKLRVHIFPGTSPLPLASEGIAVDDIRIFNCLIPDAQFTFSNTGTTVFFTNTSVNATSYLWKFGDGGTATTMNTSHNYAGTGVYYATLIAYSDCSVDSITQVINLTGIDEHDDGYDISCSPSPNNGIFGIQATLPGKDINIKIYSISGALLFSQRMELSGGKLKSVIELSPAAKGLYYIRFESEQVQAIRKIIIE